MDVHLNSHQTRALRIKESFSMVLDREWKEDAMKKKNTTQKELEE